VSAAPLPQAPFDPLLDWAHELGCTAEEVLSAMSESGRVHFERSPTEQYELDLGAPA